MKEGLAQGNRGSVIHQQDMKSLLADVERQRSVITRFVSRNVRNRDDVEDLVQSTLARATKSLDSFRCECPLSQWVLKIAVNEVRLHYARVAPKQSRTVSLSVEFIEPTSPSQEPNTEAVSPLIKVIEQTCSQDEARVILLVYQGHSCEAAASILSMKAATARSHLLRGRAKVLAALFAQDDSGLVTTSAVQVAFERAKTVPPPLTSKEVAAFVAKKSKSEAFRSACLKIARHVVVQTMVCIWGLLS